MKCFVFVVAFLAVATAQQYYDQAFDFMYMPPMSMMRMNPSAQQRGRSLSGGFPQNYPHTIGHTDPRHTHTSGCRDESPYAPHPHPQHQSQQPTGAYIPPTNHQNPQYAQHPQQQQYPQHQPQQQHLPNNYHHQPQQQPHTLGYSANHQIVQAVQAPQNLYEILLPQKNELEDDYQTKQRLSASYPVKKQHRYPLTPPSLRFKIGLVADLGKDSKTKNGTFISYIREGHLIVTKNNKEKEEEKEKDKESRGQATPTATGAAADEKDKETSTPTPPTASHNITVEFKDDVGVQKLESGLNDAGQGMELSTLNVFHGKLYACDDQTGIVYELVTSPEIENITLTPWVILPNQGTRSTFKCEWATVKDNHLWIGSLGIPTYKDREGEPDKLMVKKISPQGHVTEIDWTSNYEKLFKAAGVDFNTGFVNQEAVAWSEVQHKWLFTPRRLSKEKFDKATIDKTGSNLAFLVDDQFEDIQTKELGELMKSQGFTSVKFIPGSQDQLILALKAGTDEAGNMVSTLSVYDIEGNEIMKPTVVTNGTYAGVEFL